MEELFHKVLFGLPMQPLAHAQVPATHYTILCAQAPDAKKRIELLQTRLQTSTETSAAQNISYIVNTCIATELPPDDVEDMVERVTASARAHETWPGFIKWVCALIHYYCTDDFTISLFSEFEVPQMTVRALRDFPHDLEVVLAASVLLSHFNLHDISDGITQLTNALQVHVSDPMIAKTATHALAEFTSYYKEVPDRFLLASQEFVEANGVHTIEAVLQNHIGDEETTTYAARIAANITSSGLPNVMDADSLVMMYLAESLDRYQQSEMLCSHVLRVFSNLPRSQYIEWRSISSLFNNTQSELVVLECIHFLSGVAVNVKDMKAMIHSMGCIPRVLEMMRKYSDNAVIQEEACSLLSYLSFDSEVITASITESGGLLLVLGAMRAYPTNEDLLMAACAALSGLTFNNQSGQQVIVDNDGVALIIDAMQRGKKARLQENGCLAIGTMCWNSDLKADVVRLGGVRIIMRALEDHCASPGLVKNACRALAQVAFNCERYRDEMSACGVIPLIVRGMVLHPNYDRTQMHGCVALSYLSWTNEGNAEQIRAHGGYRVIVEAMRNHPNSHEVQEHACRALANISNVSLEDSAAALEQIVCAMRRHERVSEVQEEACRAIVTLSLVSPANKDRLYELNGADAVASALRKFPKIQLVQQEACNALAHLAYEHPNLNRAVTDLDGVGLLLIAMKNHRNTPKVQLNACGGLSALAFDNPVAQQQIFELGGVQCVIHAMENFERLRILELGCSVLGTLAWNTEIKERVAVDAIPEILKAMRVHVGNPLLQKSTCRAISQFAFNSENNRQLLAEAGAIPLIVNAMRAHLAAEKLIIHALKALTYLCWENTRVAETIISEGIEEVLQQIVQQYPSTPRVLNEAVHLSKILFRKTSGSPSPHLRLVSPPLCSPMSINFTPGVPYRSMNDLAPPSPPPQDFDTDHFYLAPIDGPTYPFASEDCTEHGGQRRGGRGRGRGAGSRRRGGHGTRGGGDETYQSPISTLEGQFSRHPPVRRRCGRGRGGGSGNEIGGSPLTDLWDDPDPHTAHGVRQQHPDDLNWQQAHLTGYGDENAAPPPWRGGRGGGNNGRRRLNSGGGGRGAYHRQPL